MASTGRILRNISPAAKAIYWKYMEICENMWKYENIWKFNSSYVAQPGRTIWDRFLRMSKMMGRRMQVFYIWVETQTSILHLRGDVYKCFTFERRRIQVFYIWGETHTSVLHLRGDGYKCFTFEGRHIKVFYTWGEMHTSVLHLKGDANKCFTFVGICI